MNVISLFKKIAQGRFCNLMTSEQKSICVKNTEILLEEHGFIKSLLANRCIDKNGLPIPWYTYPAIEYISQFDLSEKFIFEYGAGNSSLFWAERTKKVVTVENDYEWYESIRKAAPTNLELSFQPEKNNYINYIDKFNVTFDVIVIDGAYRYESAAKALSAISVNGVIILDNADRSVAIEEYSLATKLLRNAGLIQVDMSGFGPLNEYTWTTSFFFRQLFNFKTVDNIQPHKPIGGNVDPASRPH